MKLIITVILGLIFTFAFAQRKKKENYAMVLNNSHSVNKQCNPKHIGHHFNDSLLNIIVSKDNKKVTIKASKSSNFELPDSTAEIGVFKNVDFNADGKKDLMLSLGACGTGGCIYGLFLKQHGNQYSLAFMDYLKNATFKADKKGILVIKSSEEIEAYNPSKLQVTVFKYQAQKQYYKLDTTYVFIDK